MPIDRDDIIKGTDGDALSSRLSCYLKGYLPQDVQLGRILPLLVHYRLMSIESEFKRFAVGRNLRKTFFNLVDLKDESMITPRQGSMFVLKSPVINRGTWLRTVSIDMVIHSFLQAAGSDPVQIVSLGAGSDTRPFYLLPKHDNLSVFELDFEGSCRIKKWAILSDAELSGRVGAMSQPADQLPHDYASFHATDASLDTQSYHLVPCDLRQFSRDTMEGTGFDWSKRTLVLSECCICYMGTQESNDLLQLLHDQLKMGTFLIYEPMGGEQSQDSRYGQVMVNNLKTRGIDMPNLLVYNTTARQQQRFEEMGVENLVVADMKFVNYEWIGRDQVSRVSQLEMLDEMEEIDLINSHYCLVVGWWGFSWEFPYKREIE